jgi:hypothetical protein
MTMGGTTTDGSKRVLLLVGSAKRKRSTSEELGTTLLDRLSEYGLEGETLFLHRSVHTERRRTELLDAVDRAEIIVLACPLYVDALPYLVVRAFELIAEHRRARPGSDGQRFVSIMNCGFPEAHHNDTGLAICRQFAREVGFEWAGGLGLGGGEAISGEPLGKKGRMVRAVVQSLEMTATALAEDRPVPGEAVSLMARPLIPARLYTWLGTIGWKRQAKKYGAKAKLADRPYEAEADRPTGRFG